MGMEQIKVELVEWMGDDLSTVNGARVSFEKESDFEYYTAHGTEGVLSNKDKRLIKYLADHKHTTPFRHNAVKIRCHAPIFLARQLGKHQSGLSWNEVSRRYVDDIPTLYEPDFFRQRPSSSIKQGSAGKHYKSEEFLNKYYDLMYGEGNVLSVYDEMIEDNVAPEMARMVLPQSMMTSWIWTGNLLAFAHVYKERVLEGAQLEAQHFAKELDKIIRPLFPVSWGALVGEKENEETE